MIPLPIEPYLIELLELMDEQGLPLILAGGLGIKLKHRWVLRQIRDNGRRSSFKFIPDARATRDIDAFLGMEVFSRETAEGVARVRGLLEQLGYQPYEKARNFQFIKPFPPDPKQSIKIDLHAREPSADEEEFTKVNHPRVGRKGSMAFRKLQGYRTPEAFAIDEGCQSLPLTGISPGGVPFDGHVRVPHPFAQLCMKIAAAGDYERSPPEERKKNGKKHAFDIYLLIAMLDEAEMEQIQSFADRFSAVPAMTEIRATISEFFATADQAGRRTIEDEAREQGPLELDLFFGLLDELFGTSSIA